MVGKNMDMKDLVLSTLSYLEKSADEESSQTPEATQKEAPTIKEIPTKSHQTLEASEPKLNEEIASEPKESLKTEPSLSEGNDREELLRFMTTLRERILVLFEGLQSPNNRNIDAKLDLVLNFLEYQLSLIDEKMDDLNTKEQEARRY